MPGQASNAGEKVALDAITGRATQTAATKYLALGTAASDTAFTEITTAGTNGYSRQSVAWTDPTTTGSTSNTGILTFGPFSSNLASVTHCALYDASTGGNMLFYWTLTDPRDPDINDSISFAIGALVASID
jgi:hypothetical protein